MGREQYPEGMETRELAYFTAVAEELHFGRAAARLGMAQPPLSRAIQKLERRLGVRLFERNSRGVSLTPAGEVLARESAKVLDALAAATARTRRAGLAEPRLVVALKPGGDGGLLPDVLAAYRARPGAVAVELALCGVAERARLVRDGTADVAFLHRPYEDLTGFDSEPLLVEGNVAVMAAGHPLAGRDHVRLAELDAGPAPRWPGSHQEVGDPAMLMQLVALGQLVVVAPESVRDQMRRDLACVPVLDAEPTTVVLAWPEGARSRPLAEFVRTAAEIAAIRTGTEAAVRRTSAETTPHHAAADVAAGRTAAEVVARASGGVGTFRDRSHRE